MSQQQHPWNSLYDLLCDIDSADQSTPVRKPLKPHQVEQKLGLSLPEHGITFDQFIDRLRKLILSTPSSGSTAFFNQLFGGREAAAVIADAVASAMNVSMYTWKVAGPQVAMENLVIKSLCACVGYPNGEGSFTPGGSISNLIAMLMARNHAVPTLRSEGTTNICCRVYTSAESHYSIRKNAGILGIGQNHVVEIPVDTHGQMDTEALEIAIVEDLKLGFKPLLINATAGTTIRGAFDPFADIAVIARNHDLWLHIDGAFGGPLILCEQMEDTFRGVEQSDSFTWDAHKLMGVPLTCSVLLVKREGRLLENLHEQADYLFQGDALQVEPGMTSIQCGRRNDALKLWSAWQVHGRSGYAQRFSKLLGLIHYARKLVHQADDMRLVTEPQSLTLCFEVIGRSSARICARLEQEQRALIGYGSINGVQAIRLVCANPAMVHSDIDQLFMQIRSVAAQC